MATYGRDAKALLFLSTPSARRATKALTDVASDTDISIHALREEGDSITGNDVFTKLKFLSTPSARRATQPKPEEKEKVKISIHALREEGDPGTILL